LPAVRNRRHGRTKTSGERSGLNEADAAGVRECAFGRLASGPASTKPTRREFLKTAATAGAVLLAPIVVPASALGRGGAVAPSERMVMGAIGVGGRGGGDLGWMLQEADTQVVAVCDVRRTRLEAAKKAVDGKYGNTTAEGFTARYADGVKLILNINGWRGSCGVRYEGTEGWVSMADGSARAPSVNRGKSERRCGAWGLARTAKILMTAPPGPC
jgi:hypothetical protein